jgi:hypothetical protein
LGLGLLNDEQITKEMTGLTPALYENLIAYWQDHLVPLTTIDQRLTQPDVSHDQANGVTSLNPLQHFGHAKSLFVLREIRQRVGPEIFDSLVNDYVRAGGVTMGYLGFRKKLLPLFPGLPALETSLQEL